MTGWRTTEKMPRDGSTFIAKLNTPYGTELVLMKWVDESEFPWHVLWICDLLDGPIVPYQYYVDQYISDIDIFWGARWKPVQTKYLQTVNWSGDNLKVLERIKNCKEIVSYLTSLN